MALIPKPRFPDVPKLPGVPQVLRSGTFPASPPPVLLAAAAVARLWKAFTAKPQWGIFKVDTNDDSKLIQILKPDSVVDFGYRNEYRVSDFPVQDGSFSSYNKVAQPFEIMLRLSKSGTLAERSIFLGTLDALVASLELYTVLTPEATYRNVNVVSFEVTRRAAKGAYFLTDVDVMLRQIRQVSPQYTTTAAATQNAQNPDAQPTSNQGKVQSAAAPAGVTFDPATSVGPGP